MPIFATNSKGFQRKNANWCYMDNHAELYWGSEIPSQQVQSSALIESQAQQNISSADRAIHHQASSSLPGYDLNRISILDSTTPVLLKSSLSFNERGDENEQEAKRVADRILSMTLELEHEGDMPYGVITPFQSGVIKRMPSAIPASTLHNSMSNSERPTVPPMVEEVLSTSGRPLDSGARNSMEQGFGYSFGHVRIHDDPKAGESARMVNANAYTVGNHIVFGRGMYDPGTTAGNHLLAHELTHVVQQDRMVGRGGEIQLQRQTPDDVKAKVGPISGQGGLINDASRKRMSVIVGSGDTPRTIARRLLPIWNNAASNTPSGESVSKPFIRLTEEQLAKGLLVYNQFYIVLPKMSNWKTGLRLPLPIEVDMRTGEHILNSSAILLWEQTFNPTWLSLLDMVAVAPVTPTQGDLQKSAAKFREENPTIHAQSIHLSTLALRNVDEASPFIQEVFLQSGSDQIDLALAFLDEIVIHQFELLASQRGGQEIINLIRNVLATAPATLSESQQKSLDRAHRLFSRHGLFTSETAENVRQIYVRKVPGCHCMAAVYHGIEGLYSEKVSKAIQNQVGKDAERVRRKTGRDTNHMNRIMETVQARGMAGPETLLTYNANAHTWQPDPQATLFSMTNQGVSGWYFFGLSLHAAWHSVILAVDRTDTANPRIYWMDQYSRGFSKDVTGVLVSEMSDWVPPYGFPPSRLWQLIPTADTLIILN